MSRITFRKLALVLVAAIAALLFASVSSASAGEQEEYPVPDCSLSVSPENPTAGDEITISGENWPAGATVVVSVGGVDLDPVTADDAGAWSTTYTIPADTEAGDVEVTADGCEGGESEVLGTTITVAAAAVEAEPLPATGSSSTEPLVRTAAVLIAAGVFLVYAVRRRSQAASS